MARETIVKTIDGLEYSFHQMPPKQSMRLLVRIFKVLGAPAGAAVSGTAGDTESILDKDLDLSRVMGALCDRLDEDVVESIIDDLLSQAICKGHGEVSRQFDVLFGGRLPHLFKVVAAALKAEYSDFFDAWSGVAGGLAAKLKGMTPGRETSRGTSGGR